MTKEEQVLAELRQATREARECLKDFRAVIKEYHSLVDNWKDYVNSRIVKEVDEYLDHFKVVQLKAVDKASEAVFARFDRLYDLLTTGGDHKRESIVELIEKLAIKEELRRRL